MNMSRDRNRPALVAAVIAFAILNGCQPDIEPWVQSFLDDVELDHPVKCGMFLDEITAAVDQYNKQYGWDDSKKNQSELFKNNYVYMEFDRDVKRSEGTVTLWTNGKGQFWTECTLKENRVVSVYIIPGNWTWKWGKAYRIEGPGPDVIDLNGE